MPRLSPLPTRLASAALACLTSTAAFADEAAIGRHLSVELNAVETTGNACKLTFLVINGHDAPIEKLVYETVLFDSQGQVDRLTLFEFGTLPPARPRVRQFSVAGLSCDNLGQVLINGAHACTATDLPDDACEAGLTLATRTDVEISG